MSIILLSGISCKKETPETAYQACVQAEELYNAASDSSDEESNALFEKAKEAYSQFFQQYINTPYAQKIFSESRWVRRLNQDQLEAVISKVTDDAFKAGSDYTNAADRLKYMKISAVGNPFIDIVSCDTTDAEIKLSDYAGKGKYILIDFWASWCPDCRVEMPSLVALYEQFKGEKFDIVGYSLDRDAEAWKKGINDMNMSWIQMSDLGYWTSEGSKRYAVQWIPLTVLLSPEGEILARGLSISELTAKLQELL